MIEIISLFLRNFQKITLNKQKQDKQKFFFNLKNLSQ